jgi:hypothetical protein
LPSSGLCSIRGASGGLSLAEPKGNGTAVVTLELEPNARAIGFGAALSVISGRIEHGKNIKMQPGGANNESNTRTLTYTIDQTSEESLLNFS